AHDTISLRCFYGRIESGTFGTYLAAYQWRLDTGSRFQRKLAAPSYQHPIYTPAVGLSIGYDYYFLNGRYVQECKKTRKQFIKKIGDSCNYFSIAANSFGRYYDFIIT